MGELTQDNTPNTDKQPGGLQQVKELIDGLCFVSTPRGTPWQEMTISFPPQEQTEACRYVIQRLLHVKPEDAIVATMSLDANGRKGLSLRNMRATNEKSQNPYIHLWFVTEDGRAMSAIEQVTCGWISPEDVSLRRDVVSSLTREPEVKVAL